MPGTLIELRRELRRLVNPKRAQGLGRFFKTGKGEYGEGDLFLGLTVPMSRTLAKAYSYLNIKELGQLLGSKYHEERLIALLILVEQYTRGNGAERERIFRFYLNSTKRINNWDLVDLSAEKIIGPQLWGMSTSLLTRLARSQNVWERRIAILTTFYFIKQGAYTETLRLARLLMRDQHDLIHKAVGWMLREVGKRSNKTLEQFLNRYAHRLPRTMLRYAIERLPEPKRLAYLTARPTI